MHLLLRNIRTTRFSSVAPKMNLTPKHPPPAQHVAAEKHRTANTDAYIEETLSECKFEARKRLMRYNSLLTLLEVISEMRTCLQT